MQSLHGEDLINILETEKSKQRIPQRTARKSFYTLKSWVEQTMLYPISEIYAGKANINLKEYARLEKICEDVFRFTKLKPTDRLFKSELASAWRELEVCYNLSTQFPIKPEYVVEKKHSFLAAAKELTVMLENTYKKDPILKSYYYEWKIAYQDLKELVHAI